MNYVTAQEAREYFGISGTTLKMWTDSGKIKTKYLSERKVLYDIDSLDEYNSNLDLDQKKIKNFDKFYQIFKEFEKSLDK